MNVNVIIPFYKNLDTIENLIRSLEDQDYKDFDVTIVIDGEDKKVQKKLTDMCFESTGKSKRSIKVFIETLIKNAGASAARNHGAYISGENLETDNGNNILFFVDADCVIYPGMLGECVRELNRNKSIDFVYGNYRYDNKRNYLSCEYDPFKLNTMNYISTMSPIRRRAFNKVGGFKDAPYFQDWSLFYRMAQKGMKGKFINQFIFSTKTSTEDSISGTKGLTLSDKAKVFRAKHNISDKSLVTTSWGADHQALQRAKMLGSDFLANIQQDMKIMPSNYQFDNWKATYMVGCFNESPDALGNHFGAMVGKSIVHFIGTDAFHLFNLHPVFFLQDIRKKFIENNVSVFVNSRRCLRELQLCGLDMAKLLYTPIYNMEQYKYNVDPPEQFTVGVYYSDSSPMMKLDGANGHSNLPLVMDVASAMPTIKFKFFGGFRKYVPKDIEAKVPSNVEFCGRIKEDDMCDFINSCSMIVRSTIHDGFPQLPVQFMLCGRQALISCPEVDMKFHERLSHEEIFDCYDDAKAEMIDKIYKMAKDPLKLKYKVKEVYEYYHGLLNVDNFRSEIYKAIDDDCGCRNLGKKMDKSGMCEHELKEYVENKENI